MAYFNAELHEAAQEAATLLEAIAKAPGCHGYTASVAARLRGALAMGDHDAQPLLMAARDVVSDVYGYAGTHGVKGRAGREATARVNARAAALQAAISGTDPQKPVEVARCVKGFVQ